MKSKIVLEGIDGAGKTTLAEKIVRENPDMNYEIVHCSRNTPNDFGYFTGLLMSKKNIIFDRFCYGQFIYQTREDRSKNRWLDFQQLKILETMMNNPVFDTEVYYVYADIETCYNNCKKDNQDSYYTLDYLKDLDSRYRYFFSNISNIDVTYYFNDYKNTGSDDYNSSGTYKDFDYSSLPPVIAVDFDGVLAVHAFPDIHKAVVNTQLIDELKDRQKNGEKIILWTNRTGEAIVDACNLLADYEFYPDAVNDNIEEVKSNLSGGPRKVWADQFIDDKSVYYKFDPDVSSN